VGSETPRGFNHGPAMGPGVSTTNNFAFISSGFLTSAALALTRASRIEPLSANVRARELDNAGNLQRTSKLGAGQARTLSNCGYGI
jgi:hypothetical protein